MTEEEEIEKLKGLIESTKQTKYGSVWYSPYGMIYICKNGEYAAIRGAELPEHLKGLNET